MDVFMVWFLYIGCVLLFEVEPLQKLFLCVDCHFEDVRTVPVLYSEFFEKMFPPTLKA